MQVNVQTWDVKRAVYQAVNCTGVSRSYSAFLSGGSNSPSSIDVPGSEVISTVNANTSSPSTFEEYYLYSIMTTLAELQFFLEFGTEPQGEMQVANAPVLTIAGLSFNGGSFGSYELDGNITWKDNMSLALETFAQNVTLSLLSGQIFNFNPDDPDVLENVTRTCAYSFAAYEYTPYRLFLTYGIAIFVAVLCAVWGSIAIGQNGVAETMDFSRMLQAILNEKLLSVKNMLDRDTRLKADNTIEGRLVPSLL